ncbi:DUF1360 domain-containing protein [Bacillus massiliglaciei]|uniref:DUF1360 domain-containing protein n=1 Tax=Bacillus massiliglaciei TaxID=1816693 RepID=UPI000AEF511B|nr:DUF1360 domain-containing protein [Bacillus massiliglaciei]
MLISETGWVAFLMLGLASFRLTRLIVFDKITERFRRPFFDEIEETDSSGEKEIFLVPKRSGIKGWIGELLSCYWCTGVWVSLFLLLLYVNGWFLGECLILLFSIAAVGSLLETLNTKWLGD